MFKQDETNKRLGSGLSQTGLYDQLPKVEILKSINSLPLENYDQVYFLDGNESNYLNPNPSLKDKKILFIIGYERGFSDQEIKNFKEKSILGVKISDAIQRVEFAIHGVLSQVEWINNYANN